jgi:hypothetical protein
MRAAKTALEAKAAVRARFAESVPVSLKRESEWSTLKGGHRTGSRTLRDQRQSSDQAPRVLANRNESNTLPSFRMFARKRASRKNPAFCSRRADAWLLSKDWA